MNIVFWFLIPVWGQNFIWLTGSCNYLWTTTIILFFLVPYRLKNDNSAYKINMFIFSISFLMAGKNTIGNYIRWYNRIEQIQKEKTDGNYIIEVNQINRTDKHTAMYELEDVEEDSSNWTNNVISRYFGIESIILGSSEPDRLSFGKKTIKQLFIPPWGIIKSIRTPR